MSEKVAVNQELSPEVSCLAKMENLNTRTEQNIIKVEEQFILNILEKNNPLNLQVCVDRKNEDYPQYYLVKDSITLNTPLSRDEILPLAQKISEIVNIPVPIYIDWKFDFRVIAVNDSLWSFNSSFFQDSILEKHEDNGIGKKEREKEITFKNNKIEELFKFVGNLRQNPKDFIESRILDSNKQIGFQENAVTQTIAAIQNSKNSKTQIAQQ